MAASGKLALVFQGLSTVAIVTLAGLAVRHEIKSRGQRTSFLGSSAATHQRNAARDRRRIAAASDTFERALARGDCRGALEDLFDLERLTGELRSEIRAGAGGRAVATGRKAFDERCRVQSR